MAGNRVVITGIGLVTPLGLGAAHNFSRLVNGASGLVSTASLNVSEESKSLYSQIPSKIVGVVPEGPISQGKFDIKDHNIKDSRRLGKFSQYALVAAAEALDDAQWHPEHDSPEVYDTGVMVGSCIGSFEDVYNNATSFHDRGYRRIAPLFVPKYLNNMASGAVAMHFGFKGPLHSVSTACATGSNALGDAWRFVKDGYCDIAVAGATEAVVHPLALAGFARAKSTTTSFNDDPSKASRPFDKQRSGFVLSEGSGILVMETLEHALARGVKKIYGEIVGYGMSSDAYHITTPSENGKGAARAMRCALKTAGITPDKIDYINAHATSTQLGDRAENQAIKSIFEDYKHKLVVGSNKGAIGHLLGAAGAVEAAFALLSMKHGVVPPTLNCETPGDPENDKDYIFNYAANEKVEKNIEYALSNSFGFGGVNASLVFKKFNDIL
ncbi:fatty acid synthase [Saccharomycopsis crataegensis]|uniref:3-oxoacyl-[acyl-carrier-protein] synthase n=1 Tax=Saccharomycopsis crataegensis TaxID=43959 RepID=A0AAV5QR36_9ASCO|nr:fatty acid synthase [Saccharomycopsis crataegensis]